MKKCYLIGEKLCHSRSPQIHNLISNGDYSYDLLEIKPSDLADFIKKRDFFGLNVTIPYKKTVIPLLDDIDSEAKKIGCVNTIVNDNGKLFGYNTDAFGMESALKRSMISVVGKSIAILGTGGTSETAAYVMTKLGAKKIVKVGRTSEINYLNIYDHDIDVIINTTPRGMYPKIFDSPIQLSRFSRITDVFDVIYNPLRTQLVLDAKTNGIRSSNGLFMLIMQAVGSAEKFTGKPIPSAFCEKALHAVENSLKSIIFIGMPGCGKTTIAKKLGQILGMNVTDTDELFVNRFGITIPKAFSDYGENYFREKESEIVDIVTKSSPSIISTGGGTLLRAENTAKLKSCGICVYIKRNTDKLSDKDRPLSNGGRAKIDQLFNERKEIYEKYSDVVIDNNTELSTAVNEAIRRINEYTCY